MSFTFLHPIYTCIFNIPLSLVFNLIFHSVANYACFHPQLGKSVILVKAHFKTLQYLEYIDQTEAQTPVVFLIRNPFNAIVAERTRYLIATVSEYWNDTHINSDITENQFGELKKTRLYSCRRS